MLRCKEKQVFMKKKNKYYNWSNYKNKYIKEIKLVHSLRTRTTIYGKPSNKRTMGYLHSSSISQTEKCISCVQTRHSDLDVWSDPVLIIISSRIMLESNLFPIFITQICNKVSGLGRLLHWKKRVTGDYVNSTRIR